MTSTVEVTATDDARRPRKRARISQTNTPNAAGSARAKPLRGRRGALRNLLEMPVDIMYEVSIALNSDIRHPVLMLPTLNAAGF